MAGMCGEGGKNEMARGVGRGVGMRLMEEEGWVGMRLSGEEGWGWNEVKGGARLGLDGFKLIVCRMVGENHSREWLDMAWVRGCGEKSTRGVDKRGRP